MFGQGRSDHVNFINVGVPTVFFSDATGPCYHTDSDDDRGRRLRQARPQIGILQRAVQTLASTNTLPTFTPTGTPLATYADASVLRDAIDALQVDLATVPGRDRRRSSPAIASSWTGSRRRSGRVRQHRR